MKDTLLAKFRESLSKHRDNLIEWLQKNQFSPVHFSKGKEEIVLDSDLDAVNELNEVLESMERGEFGQCELCEGTVETERLELDYTTKVCLAHYSEDQIRSLERELEMAAKVQRQMAPCNVPDLPGLEIHVYSQPAHIVSGDYYDFFKFQDGSPGIVIADVMGKGVSASMLMSNLQASVRILGSEYDQPETLTSRLNELFQHNISLIRFISVFIAKVDIETGSLIYCNAGHHPPVFYRPVPESINWLNPTAPAIGLTRDARFDSGSVEFRSGDLVLLYTDGVVEAKNSEGAEFGEEGLTAYVRSNPDLPVERFVTDLWDKVRRTGNEVHDDATLLALRRKS